MGTLDAQSKLLPKSYNMYMHALSYSVGHTCLLSTFERWDRVRFAGFARNSNTASDLPDPVGSSYLQTENNAIV
jgi:hypothetical protein